MADRIILIKENLDQFAVRVDGWNLWNVIELLVVALSIGFVFGYMFAIKFGRARTRIIVPAGLQIVEKDSSSVGTQSNWPPRRSIGAQSQCTYKRKLETPRFKVLPQTVDGVFDISYSDWEVD